MKNNRIVIGCTEPSAFQDDVLNTIEAFFDGNPLKLCQNEEDDLIHWLDQCDAVILSGGTDIHPRVYGGAVYNDFNFRKFDVKRDRREIKIITHCLKQGIPMLGICRGHQMLGVYHGMEFEPDLSTSLVCHQPIHQNISHAPDEPMHWVKLTPSSAKQYEAKDQMEPSGKKSDKRYLWVNSFHHQGLHYRGAKENNVVVLGTADGLKKPIVELMRAKNHLWVSCQWHPEYDWRENAASRMVLTKFKDIIEKQLKK